MKKEKKAKVLSDREFKRVLAVANSMRHAERNVAILYLSFALGLRVKEISSLKVSDIFDESLKIKTEIVLRSDITKGAKSRRVYISNADLCKSLYALISLKKFTNYSVHMNKALFESAKGGHFSPNTLQMLMKRIYVAAGIFEASSHSGRRTFATSLIENGIDIKAVSVLMGHSSVAMTARYIDENPVRLNRICQYVKFGVTGDS